jgi:hypothetical protein
MQPDKSALTDLIARVEKASGPDRELDADIDVALFGGETVWKQANYIMEQYPVSRRPSRGHVGGFANEAIPLYTQSLDAVEALVERELPNHDWQVFRTVGAGWYAIIDKGHAEQHGRSEANAAIALLLALLKAMEARGANE